MILDCTQHDPDDRPDFTQIRGRMVCLEGGGGAREDSKRDEGEGRRKGE